MQDGASADEADARQDAEGKSHQVELDEGIGRLPVVFISRLSG
jgi:hypothetical protein